MFKLFSAFRKDKVWDFNGGIHPPEMKTQSNGTPLRQVSLPQRFVIPLKQHIGAEGELCVKVGDRVLRGQPLPNSKYPNLVFLCPRLLDRGRMEYPSGYPIRCSQLVS